MDWTPLEQAAVTAAATVITLATPLVAAWTAVHIRNQKVAALVLKAEALAAGVAHDSLTSAVARPGPLDWNAAKETAKIEGLAAAQAELGVIPSLAAVSAGLAVLLAPDASAPAGNAATATATASSGGSAAALAEPGPAIAE